MKIDIFKSEQLKFITNIWVVLSVIGVLVFIPAMTVLLGEEAEGGKLLLGENKLMQSFYFGQVGFGLVTALYFGQEFNNSTLRTSLLSTPDRIEFLAVKSACLITWIMAIFAVSMGISLAVLKIGYDIPLSTELIMSMLPAFIASVEISIIMAEIVVITRSTIVSLAIVVSMVLGMGMLLLNYCKAVRFVPVLLTMNSFMTTPVSAYLGMWTGILIQGIWCVVLAVVSGVLFWRRSVR